MVLPYLKIMFMSKEISMLYNSISNQNEKGGKCSINLDIMSDKTYYIIELQKRMTNYNIEFYSKENGEEPFSMMVFLKFEQSRVQIFQEYYISLR